MNILIITDVEGLADVNVLDAIHDTSPLYAETQKALCRDINLVADTCKACNADNNVYFIDGHYKGTNVIPELISPNAVQVALGEWEDMLVNGRFDCVYELGAHARAGSFAFLDHTMDSVRVFSHRIGGKEVSELAIEAYFAGAYGIPTVFCSGDDTFCEQAKEYVPDIVAVPVKRMISRNSAENYPDWKERLVTGVKEALAKASSIKPVTVALPTTVEITYTRADYCEDTLRLCGSGCERIGARTLRKNVTAVRHCQDLMI